MLPRNKLKLILVAVSILLTAIPNMAFGQDATVELMHIMGYPIANPRTASIPVGASVKFQCSMSCDVGGGGAWVQQIAGPANVFYTKINLSPCDGTPHQAAGPFTVAGVYLYEAFCPSGSTQRGISEQDTIIVTAAPAVPALTQWGLISLTVVLLAIATWVFLWRRKVVGVRS